MPKTKEDLLKSREIRKKVLEKYGDVPTSVWEIDYAVGKNITEYGRKQQEVALGRHKKMDYDKNLYDNFSMSSQNVRGKNGGLSTFPPDLVKRVLQYYTNKGDIVLDLACISGNTKISIPGGEAKIEDLVGKEEVYVYCHDGKTLHLRKAYNIRKTKAASKVLKLYFDNGESLLITPEHKLMTTLGEWVESKDSINHSIVPFCRKLHTNYNHKVIKIEKYPILIDVYNMEVEEFNNYFANGVCVHNCGHNSRMEAIYLLERNYIGYDINQEFMQFNREVAQKIQSDAFGLRNKSSIELIEHTSEYLDQEDNSVDLVFTSPPYWRIEDYGNHPDQLGKAGTYDEFLNKLKSCINEGFRVLKPGKFCVINVNDFRYNNEFYPYHADIIRLYKEVGFKLWDIIVIKWKSAIGAAFASQVEERKVTAKAHEYLIVGKKNGIDQNVRKIVDEFIVEHKNVWEELAKK